MRTDHAQLSSLASSLDDLTRRLTAIAERYQDTEQDDLARELYEVERSLRAGTRRLAGVVASLRDG